MSKEKGIRALEAIVKYEKKNLKDIFKESQEDRAEYGYVVRDGEVKKVVGELERIPGELLEGINFEGAAFFHTHPRHSSATLSIGDVVLAVLRCGERGMDGIGVIAEDEYRYWEIEPDIARSLLEEWKKNTEEWERALEELKKAEERGDKEAMERYARITYSCRSKKGAITKKAKKLLKPVLYGRTMDITLEKKPPEKEEKYHVESWWLFYTPQFPEKYQWDYQIGGKWEDKKFKTFEEAREFVKKGEAKLFIPSIHGEGVAIWAPVDIPHFVLKVGERFEIPPKEYVIDRPAFYSTTKKWQWRVGIYNKETKKWDSKEMFEDELLKLREKAEKEEEMTNSSEPLSDREMRVIERLKTLGVKIDEPPIINMVGKTKTVVGKIDSYRLNFVVGDIQKEDMEEFDTLRIDDKVVWVKKSPMLTALKEKLRRGEKKPKVMKLVPEYGGLKRFEQQDMTLTEKLQLKYLKEHGNL